MRRPGPAGGFAALCAAALALAAVFVSLGRWQLERAEQARAVAAEYRDAAGQAALTDPPAADPGRFRYRRLTLTGRYDGEHHVLLDNITRGGAAGYYVLTPFVPASGGPPVLVNRGWVEAGPDRRVAPRIEVADPRRSRRLAGRIDRLPSAALSLGGKPETVREGVYRASFPSIEELERLLGAELAPFQLLLDPEEPDGYVRSWAPATTRADRNTAYAGQWFIMAAGAAGLAVWAAARAYRATRGHSDDDEAAT